MEENEISGIVISAAIEVHRALGPGLLESVYQRCLVMELQHRGVSVSTEVQVIVEYRGEVMPDAYRLDLLVEDKIVVELKTVNALTDTHKAQLLTYVRLTKKKLGLLINFNEALLKKGVKRVVNKL